MAFAGMCQVICAGPTVSGQAEIQLTANDGTFTERFFLNHPAVSREVLATALAAITANKAVFCEIPDEQTPYSEMTRILLIR